MILFLDVFACFFIVLMGSIGFRRGFIEEVGRLIGLIVSTVFSLKYYLSLSAKILTFVQLNTFVVMVISFSIIFVLILFIVRVLTRFFHILLTSTGTKFANRSMGFIFGALKGIIILMIFYWSIDLFPTNKWVSIIQKESYLSYRFTNTRFIIINLFHLEDPIKEGEIFLKDMMKNDTMLNNGKS
ncbi:MAG: CvpA family protein [Candidatus Neomarinimicrobiota bacterium]|nr:CvpA family protein [Candidatus Neomarinimicrobiota bacterium]